MAVIPPWEHAEDGRVSGLLLRLGTFCFSRAASGFSFFFDVLGVELPEPPERLWPWPSPSPKSAGERARILGDSAGGAFGPFLRDLREADFRDAVSAADAVRVSSLPPGPECCSIGPDMTRQDS
jgi:hypothetical protein